MKQLEFKLFVELKDDSMLAACRGIRLKKFVAAPRKSRQYKDLADLLPQ